MAGTEVEPGQLEGPREMPVGLVEQAQVLVRRPDHPPDRNLDLRPSGQLDPDPLRCLVERLADGSIRTRAPERIG